MSKDFNALIKKMSPESQARIKARSQELIEEYQTLQEIRKDLKVPQKKVAQKMKVEQPAISKLEQRTDIHISSLRDYIEALGGKLELIVKMPGKQIMKINRFNHAVPA